MCVCVHACKLYARASLPFGLYLMLRSVRLYTWISVRPSACPYVCDCVSIHQSINPSVCPYIAPREDHVAMTINSVHGVHVLDSAAFFIGNCSHTKYQPASPARLPGGSASSAGVELRTAGAAVGHEPKEVWHACTHYVHICTHGHPSIYLLRRIHMPIH